MRRDMKCINKNDIEPCNIENISFIVPTNLPVFLVFHLTVKEKLTADPESEIATTSLRVSLLCPVNTAHYFY